MPLAISAAAISRTLARSLAGSTSTVSAWRSARKNRHSASSCIRTQRRIAPSRLPRWRSPVGWMPETTRMASLVIRHFFGLRAAPQRGDRFAVDAADHPGDREIDEAADADQRAKAEHALQHAAEEQVAGEQLRPHRAPRAIARAAISCLRDAADQPARHAELAARVEDAEQQREVDPGAGRGDRREAVDAHDRDQHEVGDDAGGEHAHRDPHRRLDVLARVEGRGQHLDQHIGGQAGDQDGEDVAGDRALPRRYIRRPG